MQTVEVLAALICPNVSRFPQTLPSYLGPHLCATDFSICRKSLTGTGEANSFAFESVHDLVNKRVKLLPFALCSI